MDDPDPRVMRSPGDNPPETGHGGRRVLAWLGLGVVALLVLLAVGVGYIGQPQRASALLLDRLGNTLGLRITASGQSEYRLRGTPQLVLRDVVAQRPGDATPLLRAERVLVSLPWSTLRARGTDLTMQRVELDAPVLDLPALRRWQATRPPGPTRIPTLGDGLRVVRGRIVNARWSIDGIDLALPSLAPGKPLRARVRGRYMAPPSRVPFDLEVAMSAPRSGADLVASGGVDIQRAGWSLPGHVRLSGPLWLEDGDLRMAPAKLGFSGRYQSASSTLPFDLGAFGQLQFADGTWAMDPAWLVLDGSGMLPDAAARGAVALGRRLVLHLDGTLARWPDAWPALPPPLSASRAPLAFVLDYVGRLGFLDPAGLGLRRGQTVFDARFRLPQVQAWLEEKSSRSALPPLDGRLRTPRLQIAGAQLDGVEIDFDEPSLAPPQAIR